MADAVKSTISTFQQPSFAPPAPSATFDFGQPQPLDISPTYNLPTPPSFSPAPYSSTYDFGQQQAYQPEPLDISPGYSYYPTFSEAEYTQPYGQAPQAAPVLDFSPAPYSSTYDFGQEQAYRPEPLNISPVLNFYPEQPDGAEYVQGYEPAGSGQFGFGGILDLAGDAAGMIGQAGNAYRNSGFVENFNAQTAWNGLTDFNQGVVDRARQQTFDNGQMSPWDALTASGSEGIYNATGYDTNNLPGILPAVVDQTLSPASLLTAAGGAQAGTALRSFLPGNVGRVAANLVEPVVGGGFAARLGGEAAINAGATGGAELANAYLPENMPFRDAAVMAAGFLGGGAAVAGASGAGLSPYRPGVLGMVDDAGVPKPGKATGPQQKAIDDWVGTRSDVDVFYSEGRPYFRSEAPITPRTVGDTVDTPLGQGTVIDVRSAGTETGYTVQITRPAPGTPARRGYQITVRGEIDIPNPEFRAASDAVLEAVRKESNLRRIGIPEREIAQGRVQQASGIMGALDEGRAAGLGGEELAVRARSGAATGPLRQTFTEPIALEPTQRIALFDEMTRMVEAGEMRQFEYLTAVKATQKLLNGEGLQPAEIKLLRNVFGEEVAQAVASRPQTSAQMRRAELREIEQGRALEQKLLDRKQREATQAIQRANREAFNAQVTKDSRELRLAEQARLKAVREGTAPPVTTSRELDRLMDTRERALKLSNDADAAEIAAGRKLQDNINARNAKTEAAEQVRANRKAFSDQVRKDNRIPNDEQLIRKAEDIMGESWPEKSSLRQEGVDAIKYWLEGNRVILDAIKPEDETGLIRSITAGIKGETPNSYITTLLQRRALIESALKHAGYDEDAAKSVADTLMRAELAQRYGATLKKGLPVKPGDVVLPPDVKAVLDAAQAQAGGIAYGASRFSSDWKNTAFWLDVGVLGQQVGKAVMTGGIPLFAGTVNRILMTLQAPHARVNYSEKAMAKQMAYQLDGVVQGGRTGIVINPEDGTFLRHIPGLKKSDPKIGEYIGRFTDFQFGTVLGGVRNLIYEGNLTVAHLLGQDITDPIIRAKYAANANAITSAGQFSVVRSRATMEQAAILSPSMRRAQVQHIAQMARLFTPKFRGSGPDRTIAAMSILSATIGIAVIGKYMNDLMGVDEFEMDPSKPGFGNITLPNGLVINVFPQEQVVKAMAQSLRHLSEQDEESLESAIKDWGKLFLGSASPALGGVTKLGGFGYQPGEGYKWGDWGEGKTLGERVLNVAPIPPVIPNLYEEGATVLGTALEFAGVNTYQESDYTARDRALKDDPNFGKPFKELDKGQQQDAIAQYGDVEWDQAEVPTEDQVDLGFANLERANAQAADELKRELDRGLRGRDFVEAVQEYNSKKAAHWDAAIGPDLEAWLDANRKDPASVRDAFYAMYSGVEMPIGADGEPDYETFFAQRDEVLRQAAAEGVPEWYITGRNVPPGETSARQQVADPVVANALEYYANGQESIRDSGYWDLRDRAWTELNSQAAAPGYVPGQTYQEYRESVREELRQAGVPEYNIENLISTKHPVLSKFNDVYKERYLYQWADQNPEVTQLLVEWEYLNPDAKLKKYLEYLAGR